MFHRDASKRGGLASQCKACAKERLAARYLATRETARPRMRAYYLATRVLKKTGPAPVFDRSYFNAQQRKYKLEHPERFAAREAARRARKFSSTPAWANEFFVEEAYALAKLRTKVFGFAWHVDHIVPLNSKKVCGLHTHSNLQVIPGAENISKGNRNWPDMPATQ